MIFYKNLIRILQILIKSYKIRVEKAEFYLHFLKQYIILGMYNPKKRGAWKMQKSNRRYRTVGVDLLYDLAGSFLLGIGIFCFARKANIAPGGASGIGIMLQYLWGIPIGTATILVNIPLLVVAYYKLGRDFVLKTLKTLLISSILLDGVITPLFPQYSGDRMLASIFGGLCMGAGLSLVFLRGSTTGGTDILSYLIEQKYPHIQIGTGLMLIDGVILGASVLVFGNLESGLFGAVSLFCQMKVIDGMIYGIDRGKKILIISDKSEKIAYRIMTETKRGATFFQAQGAYTKKPVSIILCVARMREYAKIQSIVHDEDRHAFIIVSEASKILGTGFHPIQKQD